MGIRNREIRNEFWQGFAPKFATKCDFFKGISVVNNHETWYRRVINGVHIGFSVKNWARNRNVGVFIHLESTCREWNKRIFDFFEQNQAQIEKVFGEPLNWQRNNNRISSRIDFTENLNLNDPLSRQAIEDFLTKQMQKLITTFMPYICQVPQK